ncbi:MAG: hypothetical protein D6755_12845, partial [Anaerolineae bacterium]
PDWTPNPLFNYSLPYWREGNIARNLGMALGLKGISSLLPLLMILAGGIWLVDDRRRMTDDGRRTADRRLPTNRPTATENTELHGLPD